MLDTPDLDPRSLSEHARANRESWNADSDTYQKRTMAPNSRFWGPWLGGLQIPEARLHVFWAKVTGRDILELGCGAAHVVDRAGQAGGPARGSGPIGEQLAHAASHGEAGVDFPLVHASAEAVPLPGRQLRTSCLRLRGP